MLINYFFLKKQIEEYGISKKNSWRVIKKIRKMDKTLKAEFGRWYKTGAEPATEIDGIDFRTLVDVFAINEINAFLTLDWLLREPEEAKRALVAPIDTVVSDESLTNSGTEGVESEEDTSDVEIEEEDKL